MNLKLIQILERTILWTVLVVVSMPCYASEIGSATSYGALLKTVFMLVVVLIVCFISIFVLKKYQSNRYSSASIIKPVSVFHISSKEKLMVIDAFDHYMLLSVSSSGIQLLHKTDRPSQDNISREPDERNPFVKYLKHHLSLRASHENV